MAEESANGKVFADLKILAFSWAMVGPLTLKFFADYGATVIRVETFSRPCVTRMSSPFADGKAGVNRSGYFNHFSANMLSMSLNMGHPDSLGLARELVAKSDVVMENFTPGVMERWGLSYEELKKIKPDIIMVRQNGFGSDSPYRNLAAFGMILAAVVGIPNFIGWPDRGPLPVGVWGLHRLHQPEVCLRCVDRCPRLSGKDGKGAAHRPCPVRDGHLFLPSGRAGLCGERQRAGPER